MQYSQIILDEPLRSKVRYCNSFPNVKVMNKGE